MNFLSTEQWKRIRAFASHKMIYFAVKWTFYTQTRGFWWVFDDFYRKSYGFLWVFFYVWWILKLIQAKVMFLMRFLDFFVYFELKFEWFCIILREIKTLWTMFASICRAFRWNQGFLVKILVFLGKFFWFCLENCWLFGFFFDFLGKFFDFFR